MAGEMKGQDGTAKSGFVQNSQNREPRRCGNCVWFAMGSCGNELVVLDPEVPKNENGRAIVDEDDCSNGFQSMGNAIIYVIRHGETKNNKENRFRGWVDVPLDKEGIEQAKQARKYLEDKGIKRVFCSDLDRTIETAKLAMPGKRSEKDPLLRPWDVGVFSGKERDLYQGSFNYFIDNPDVPIPDGESLKEFSERQKKAFVKYIKEARQNGPILLVVHSSNVIQIEKLVEGKDELGRPEDTDRVTPGGIMVVLDQGDGAKAEIVFGVAEEKSANYGS